MNSKIGSQQPMSFDDEVWGIEKGWDKSPVELIPTNVAKNLNIEDYLDIQHEELSTKGEETQKIDEGEQNAKEFFEVSLHNDPVKVLDTKDILITEKAKNQAAFNRSLVSNLKIAGLKLGFALSVVAAFVTLPLSLPAAITGLLLALANLPTASGMEEDKRTEAKKMAYTGGCVLTNFYGLALLALVEIDSAQRGNS